MNAMRTYFSILNSFPAVKFCGRRQNFSRSSNLQNLLVKLDMDSNSITKYSPFADGAKATDKDCLNECCTYSVRQAKPEDCGMILRYIKDLAVYEKEEESVVEVTEKDLIKDGFGASPCFKCLVAEENIEGSKKVVGYAIYVYSYSTWKGKCLWIEDLYVRPESRGKGVGYEFLKALSKIALDDGLSKMRWLVLNWNEVAIRFYRKIDTVIEEDWRMCSLSTDGMERLLKSDS